MAADRGAVMQDITANRPAACNGSVETGAYIGGCRSSIGTESPSKMSQKHYFAICPCTQYVRMGSIDR